MGWEMGRAEQHPGLGVRASGICIPERSLSGPLCSEISGTREFLKHCWGIRDGNINLLVQCGGLAGKETSQRK